MQYLGGLRMRISITNGRSYASCNNSSEDELETLGDEPSPVRFPLSSLPAESLPQSDGKEQILTLD
jgi:hypothetical protein